MSLMSYCVSPRPLADAAIDTLRTTSKKQLPVLSVIFCPGLPWRDPLSHVIISGTSRKLSALPTPSTCYMDHLSSCCKHIYKGSNVLTAEGKTQHNYSIIRLLNTETIFPNNKTSKEKSTVHASHTTKWDLLLEWQEMVQYVNIDQTLYTTFMEQ